MAAVVGIAKGATEIILGIGDVSIDNFTFKLFYKWSVTFFITCSVAVSANQLFGDPIACEALRADKFTADDTVDLEVLNNYCWMYANFHLPMEYEDQCTRRVHANTDLYHTYYQFVSVFLMFQAAFMYAPRCIWLSMEGGLMEFLVRDKTGRVVEESDKKHKRLLVDYEELVHNKFSTYTFCFFFCELLNIVILVFQVFVTNAFLDNQYWDYGFQVYRYYMMPPEERKHITVLNPMCEVFPKVASCDYVRYGLGGDMVHKPCICILSLNIINDKVFAVLWYWHLFLLIVGANRIIGRIVQICSARTRFMLMRYRMNQTFTKNKHWKNMRRYLLTCSIGDWFVLYQMSKNMNSRFFSEFLALLSTKLNPDPDENSDPEVDICKKLLNCGSPAVSQNTETTYLNDLDEEASIGGKIDDMGIESCDNGEDKGSGGGGSGGADSEADIDKANRASVLRKKKKRELDKKLSKKQKAMIANSRLRSMD